MSKQGSHALAEGANYWLLVCQCVITDGLQSNQAVPNCRMLPLHGSISSGSSGVAVDFDQPDVGKEELAPISYRNMHNLGHGNEAVDRVSNNSVAVY